MAVAARLLNFLPWGDVLALLQEQLLLLPRWKIFGSQWRIIGRLRLFTGLLATGSSGSYSSRSYSSKSSPIGSYYFGLDSFGVPTLENNPGRNTSSVLHISWRCSCILF